MLCVCLQYRLHLADSQGDRHFPQGVNGMGSVYLNELALDFALQLQASACTHPPTSTRFHYFGDSALQNPPNGDFVAHFNPFVLF